ncbi:hypothetical protein P4H70_15285 [Paenibacillus ehimensis]|uniref:hypothetical protein n=1 Tax=Paenibacillus ehimensis TaxID=79264 RepID=UPI002DBCB935|nr:hypothetical protein [Paenibacillus ehimensis]MEC0210300.1 hypothetical protein [Paenibacillus ehimensis]
MDKSTVFKTGFGVVGAFISWVVGGLGLAFTILLPYAAGLRDRADGRLREKGA